MYFFYTFSKIIKKNVKTLVWKQQQKNCNSSCILLTNYREPNSRRVPGIRGLGVHSIAFVVTSGLSKALLFDGLQSKDRAAVLDLLVVVVPGQDGVRLGGGWAGQVKILFGLDEFWRFGWVYDDHVRSVCKSHRVSTVKIKNLICFNVFSLSWHCCFKQVFLDLVFVYCLFVAVRRWSCWNA